MPTMRDAFWNRIFTKAKENRDIVLLSADFSAPSLDQFRLELPAQYLRLGITEQNMILMATGLALEGKRPFCFAIAPFLTMRCYEQIRLYAAGMNLPITLVGVGSGLAYADSGYTHHALEDVSIMRALPHMRIFQPCDNATVERMADLVLESASPAYFRLDRYSEDRLIEDPETVATGLNVLRPVQPITIMASGYMVKTALKAADALNARGISVGVLDACILPFQQGRFRKLAETMQSLLVLEEHTLPGGLGSYVLECVSDLRLPLTVYRHGLDLSEGYVKEYSGRETVHRQYQIDVGSVMETVEKLEETHGKH